MGTYTAQILIGRNHPNHGGIKPESQIFLSENSRPGLIFQSLRSRKLQKDRWQHPKVWIPSVENMLDDALLMVALLAKEDGELIKFLEQNSDFLNERKPEIYGLRDDVRDTLYKENRRRLSEPKLIISVFEHSSLTRHLTSLAAYDLDTEVCRFADMRVYSRWTGEIHRKGLFAADGVEDKVRSRPAERCYGRPPRSRRG